MARRKRINMRIPEDLKDWIHAYTAARNTTVTQDYVEYLTRKKRAADKETNNARHPDPVPAQP